LAWKPLVVLTFTHEKGCTVLAAVKFGVLPALLID